MSISTHVVGIKPADGKWKQMKAVYDSCEQADIDVPEEVLEFFDHVTPDPRGVVVEIDCEKFSDDGVEGYIIDTTKIPKDIKFIKFYISC